MVSVQVLCTIPQPERVLKEVVGRLKSGGELRCVEHVRAQEKGARFVQRFCDAFGWAWVFDGCCLSRDVVSMVKNAGDWREAEVGKVKGEMRWATLPMMVGRFVKA